MPYTAASLADPTSADVIVAAVRWLQLTLLGTVATTIAVLSVASVGFLMLMGRVDIRRGLTVVAGCFILFGASSIVAGLQAGIGAPTAPPAIATLPPTAPLVVPSTGEVLKSEASAGGLYSHASVPNDR